MLLVTVPAPGPAKLCHCIDPEMTTSPTILTTMSNCANSPVSMSTYRTLDKVGHR